MFVVIDLCICILPNKNPVVEDERLDGNTFYQSLKWKNGIEEYHAIRCKDRIKGVWTKCQPDIMPTKGWHFVRIFFFSWHFVRPNFLVGILS